MGVRINDVLCPGGQQQYQVEKRLGEGAFGVVFMARSLQSDAKVAVKEIEEEVEDSDAVLRELALMLHFKDCPHLTRIFGAAPKPGGQGVVLLMELLDIDMLKYLQTAPTLEMRHVKLLLHQMLGALHWLHRGGVVHRDVKLANMLVYRECFLKLCDLGEAQLPGETLHRRLGTYVARAPEVLLATHPYSAASDVWAIGVAFQHLLSAMHGSAPVVDEDSCETEPHAVVSAVFDLSGVPEQSELDTMGVPKGLDTSAEEAACPKELLEPVFDNETDFDSIKVFAAAAREVAAVRRGTRFDWDAHFGAPLDPDAADLLRRLLAFSPADRISAADALRHRYFRADALFVDELRRMGTDVPVDAPPPPPEDAAPAAAAAAAAAPFVLPDTTVPALLAGLQRESEECAAAGRSVADEFYLARKSTIGNMLVSPLAIPQDVTEAHRTLFQPRRRRMHRREGSMSLTPCMQRCMTAADFADLSALLCKNSGGVPRSNSCGEMLC